MLRLFNKKNSAGKLDFSALVSELCGDSARYYLVKGTRRFSYFYRYILQRSIRSVVIEEDYVDRDYIRDYADYYSLCFSTYPKLCKRCHLFSEPYAEEDIRRIVLTGDMDGCKKLQESYEGFFVFRPLPQVAFGRTCFKRVPLITSRKENKFPAFVKIDVGFFGLRLSIEGMPFQEQDSNIAVCATSALWSAFQVTRFRFGHSACSPSAITRLATSDVIFPNRGLSVEEMVHAISSVGLGVYHEFDSSNDEAGIDYSLVKAIAFAYLDMGLPIVLVGVLEKKVLNSEKHTREFMGFHAVTVCGYQFNRHRPLLKAKAVSPKVSDGITVLFCADDQVGPYCQMKELEGAENGRNVWCTQWGADLPEPADDVTFRATNILVPLCRKIRVSYDVIESLAVKFFPSVIQAAKKHTGAVIHNAQWSIQLKECNRFKEEIRKSGWLSADVAAKILFENCPKYVWCVSAHLSRFPLLTFVLDATDISQGEHVIFAIRYGDVLQKVVAELRSNEEFMMHPFTVAYCSRDCLEYSYA